MTPLRVASAALDVATRGTPLLIVAEIQCESLTNSRRQRKTALSLIGGSLVVTRRSPRHDAEPGAALLDDAELLLVVGAGQLRLEHLQVRAVALDE